MRVFKTKNPHTEEVEFERAAIDDLQLEKLLDQSFHAHKSWSTTRLADRTALIQKLGEKLLQKKTELAQRAVTEMGKPISQAIAEIEKCAQLCFYYAENAEAFLATQIVKTDPLTRTATAQVNFESLGVVLGVMPWNFPYWQVFRFVVPAVLAGNTCVVKPPPNTPLCAEAVETLFENCQFPKGTYQNLFILESQVEAIIKDSRVAALSFTGSEKVGRILASQAGQALKKSVMELGGSDPYLILSDADLKKAAKACAFSRFQNAGQSCIAAKRIIVEASVYSEFVELFREESLLFQMGDPNISSTTLGPMARDDLREEVHRQVQKSIDMGALPLLGCEIPTQKGFFYPASILENVQKGMPVYDEEVFGPVAALIQARDESEATQIANDSAFGLGAAIFSEDRERAQRLAKKLQSGSIFINDFVRSDPRLPFGGLKASGYGRELSQFGLYEFCNIQTLVVG